MQQQGRTEEQSAANRSSALVIGATEFYRRQNVSSTLEQKSTSVRADGTRNILPSQIPLRCASFYETHLTANIILRMTTKVSVCQVPDIREDIESALKWIEKFTKQAEVEGVSLVCFPECFLQGYLTEINLAEKHAINFNSSAFKVILEQLAKYKPVIVFGLIEEEDKNLFNTAVVIKEGELIGKYRKTHLLQGEQIFKAGTEYPVFEINGLKFGINICYDTQFAEAVTNLIKQGARLILCPSNNMMRYETAEKYKYLHHEMRSERVKENQVWLMSADVTGKREGRIAYGPTSAINPHGKVVAQVSLMKTGMTVIEL